MPSRGLLILPRAQITSIQAGSKDFLIHLGFDIGLDWERFWVFGFGLVNSALF